MATGDYLADLRILAAYQHQQRRTVLFRVSIAPVANQVEVIYRAMKADGKTAATGEPVLRQTSIGKLAIWESFEYIQVMTGSLKHRTSTIRLTESGVKIAGS